MKQLRQAALALCIGAVSNGCDGAPPGEDRYARRFVPYEREWRRESEIPPLPQKTPVIAIWELSRFAPGTPPTPEQQRAARHLIERSHAAVLAHGWNDFEKGRSDGFRILPNDDRHYMNEEFILDDRILDPERPEFLMYYRTPTGMALTGFMFFARSREGRGPQLGGPLTVWHFHAWNRPRCFRSGVIAVGFVRRGGRCPTGDMGYRSPEMMHVWLVDHPEGPFATRMHIDPALLPELLARRRQERGY